MELVLAKDLEKVREVYLDVITNTPDIKEETKWDYGHYPADEIIQGYIDRNEMYLCMDGDKAAGAVALVPYQEEAYEKVRWRREFWNDQIMTVHILAVVPAYRGKSAGEEIVREAVKLAEKANMRAVRLDTLCTNKRACHLYEKLGFECRGKLNRYIEDIGDIDFVFYEMML